MRSEAFGQIGIKPTEFYRLSIVDFVLWREGWSDKMLYDQRISRQSTMLILSGLVGGKNINPQSLWPIEGDKKGAKLVMYKGALLSETLVRKLKKQEAEKKKKQGENG